MFITGDIRYQACMAHISVFVAVSQKKVRKILTMKHTRGNFSLKCFVALKAKSEGRISSCWVFHCAERVSSFFLKIV